MSKTAELEKKVEQIIMRLQYAEEVINRIEDQKENESFVLHDPIQYRIGEF